MMLIVTDPRDQERFIAERRAAGADRFDEVWEGDYVMAPLADDEHQDIQAGLVMVFRLVLDRKGRVRAGINVTDQPIIELRHRQSDQSWTV